jgi:catechol 2,3-dioxygenase-like lactoylglutathione lyase family enzyme
MSPLRLDHVVLPVHDAAAARRFYGETLGLELRSAFGGDSWGGRAWLMMVFALGDGARHLVLTVFDGLDRPHESPFPRDARHVAFAAESEEAWRAWKQKLSDANAEHWVEDHGGGPSIYIADPSGNIVEIMSAPTPSLTPRGDANAFVERWIAARR